MRIGKLLALMLVAGVVAGCDGGYATTDGERAIGGAAAGALIADATDNNVLAGAAVGALAGTYCDDLNVPGCVRRY